MEVPRAMKHLAIFLFPALLCAQPRPAARAAAVLTPAEKAVMGQVSAASLKAHVSFLASDVLEGRDTPSKGLDIAAEYIAAHFRRTGLEPAGDDGYFQNAPYALVRPNTEGFEVTLEVGGKRYSVAKGGAQIDAQKALELDSTELVRVSLGDPLASFQAAELKGKVVLASLPNFMALSAEEREKVVPALARDRAALAASQAALVVVLGAMGRAGTGPRLREATAAATPPQVTVTDLEFLKIARDLKPNVTYFASFSPFGGPVRLCLGKVAPLPQTALG
jgi:hypothetical protein